MGPISGSRAVDDERPLAEVLLDVFVYAPLGLALEARELIPKLAERGRGQADLTRLAGRMAVHRGRAEAQRLLRDMRDGTTGADRRDGRQTADLPIEGYDELSAREVISKLADLPADQLDLLLEHEQRHRGRVTVINRIRELRS